MGAGGGGRGPGESKFVLTIQPNANLQLDECNHLHTIYLKAEMKKIQAGKTN